MNFFESIRSLVFSKELVARKNGEVKEAKKKIEGFVKSVLGERSYRDLERLRRRNPTVVIDEYKAKWKGFRQHNERAIDFARTLMMVAFAWRVGAEVKGVSREKGDDYGQRRDVKFEADALAVAFLAVVASKIILKKKNVDLVGISKELVKRASLQNRGLGELLGAPLRIKENAYMQSSHSLASGKLVLDLDNNKFRNYNAAVTRHACVVSGTKSEGVLSFLVVENADRGFIGFLRGSYSSSRNSSRDSNDAVVGNLAERMKMMIFENDTSQVTVARIDVFAEKESNDKDCDDENYRPALVAYLKGSERLDGEDLALAHARESVRKLGLGRRTIQSVVDFTPTTNDELQKMVIQANARAAEVVLGERAQERKDKQLEKKQARKEKIKKVSLAMKHLPY